jgi:glycine/D-amino acid oxidase-like deaminating enzyme
MLKSDEGKTVSLWEATGDLIKKSPVADNIETDVCIVGGGIAGLTAAYLLGERGYKIAVIDDGLIGGGETCRTTAHLSNAIDDRIYRIERWHGEDKARLAVESHSEAIDEIERIATGEEIDCDLHRLDGYLFEAEDGEDDLDKELAAAHRAGLAGVRFVERAPMGEYDSGRCLLFPTRGSFTSSSISTALPAASSARGAGCSRIRGPLNGPGTVPRRSFSKTARRSRRAASYSLQTTR